MRLNVYVFVCVSILECLYLCTCACACVCVCVCVCGYRTKAPFNTAQPYLTNTASRAFSIPGGVTGGGGGRLPIPENAIRMGPPGRGGGGGKAGGGGDGEDGAVHGVLAGLAMALRAPAPVIVAGPNALQRVLHVYVHIHRCTCINTRIIDARTRVYIYVHYIYITYIHTHAYARYRCTHMNMYTRMNSYVGRQRDRESCKRAKECV
jgi:hypothetical protein